MFSSCSNLNYVKMMATSITGAGSWMSSVQTTSGTFIKNAIVIGQIIIGYIISI